MRKTIISILLACCGMSCMAQAPTLSVEGGKIQGVNTSCKDVVVYKGIPYAAPPVGDLRWKKPQAVKPWKGVRVCDKFGAASLQESLPKGIPERVGTRQSCCLTAARDGMDPWRVFHAWIWP